MSCRCEAASHHVRPSRRSFVAGFMCAAAFPAVAHAQAGGAAAADDIRFMRMAIEEARLLSSAEVAAKAQFAPISITGGVLADEAMALFAK
jgi:hypothetical protein